MLPERYALRGPEGSRRKSDHLSACALLVRIEPAMPGALPGPHGQRRRERDGGGGVLPAVARGLCGLLLHRSKGMTIHLYWLV